jgi:SAM-dependent methyltransferase
MYEASPKLYDEFYVGAGKDYEGEAAAVLRLARAGRRAATSLLDVACGTGRHLEYFSRELRCTGVDLNPEYLEAARRRCPTASFLVADMVDLALDDRFDVVTCLFSSIGHTGTVDRLHRGIASMAHRLNPGGLLVVEPWFVPDAWRVGVMSASTVDTEGGIAVRIASSGRRGDLALLDFHYLVGTTAGTGSTVSTVSTGTDGSDAGPEEPSDTGAEAQPGGVEYFVEHHELGLFTWDQYRDAFEAAGLRFHIDRYGLTGRGLVIGISGERSG